MKKNVFGIVFAVGAVIVVLILIWISELSTEKTPQLLLKAKNEAIGFPASEEQLEDGAVYWVNVAGVDHYVDHTNFVALLQRTRVLASDDYRLDGTNRLFHLSASLTPNAYYRFSQNGTNRFVRIANPQPRVQ